MLLKTGLILDINNLYFATKAKYRGRKLLISNYVKKLEEQNHTLVYKIAYSKQRPENCQSFITMLTNIGFECYFDDINWSIAMALRTTEIVTNVDCFVLGSNNFEHGRLLAYAKDKGKITKCFALNVPPLFKRYAECLEIGEDLLSETVEATQ